VRSDLGALRSQDRDADQAATVQSDCAEAKLMEALEQLLAKLTSAPGPV